MSSLIFLVIGPNSLIMISASLGLKKLKGLPLNSFKTSFGEQLAKEAEEAKKMAEEMEAKR